MEKRIKSLEDNLSSLSKLLIEMKEENKKSFSDINEAFGVINSNFKSLNQKCNLIDGKIDTLSVGMNKDIKKVSKQIDGLKVEVIKIQKVSNYSEEYENLLKIVK